MLEDLQPLFEQILERFEAEDVDGAARLLLDRTPADVADILRGFEHERKVAVLRLLPAEVAAAILTELDERSLPDLLDLLKDQEIVEMLDALDSDDAADVVAHMENDQAVRVVDLLDQVDHQDAVELSELLRYPEDSAGGVMAKEFLSVNQEHTIGKIAEGLRKLGEEELLSHQFVFVVDSSGRLLGQIPVVKVFILDPKAKAAAVMNPEPVSIEVMEDQEKVAQLFARRDLLSMAVVDTNRRLVGRITVDDVIDVMTEEATEDMARFAGSSEEEFGQTSVKAISRARLPWLMMGLLGELLSALVISRFQAGLQVKVILAFFIPLVMATGGNSGVQTSSNLIRALATGNFDRFRARRHIAREVFVGLLNGFLLGGMLVLTLVLFRQDPAVGFVIGLALMCVVVVATSIGTIVPLVLNWMGVDPALATGPFITTSNDVLGLLVYLSLAHKVLGL